MEKRYVELFWEGIAKSKSFSTRNCESYAREIENGNFSINEEEGTLTIGEYTEFNIRHLEQKYHIKCVSCGTTKKDIEYHWCFSCFSSWSNGDKSKITKNKVSDYDFLPSSDDEN